MRSFRFACGPTSAEIVLFRIYHRILVSSALRASEELFPFALFSAEPEKREVLILSVKMTSEPSTSQNVPTGLLNGIKFGLMTGEEIYVVAVVIVKELFSSCNVVETSDLADARLGLPSTTSRCGTCGSTSIKDCDGHFGDIKLPFSVYHPYLLPEIIHILNQICPGCKSIHHESRMKKSAAEWYPSVKFRISNRDLQGRKGLSVVAEVNENLPKKFQNRHISEVLPKDYWNFVPKLHVQQGLDASSIFLTPWQVFSILKQLDRDFINQYVSRRELLFLSTLPVTPNSHRIMETTHAMADGSRISFLKSHSTSTKDSPSKVSGMKWLKEVILSKRADYAFRMTMVGDPKIRLGEVGIPYDIARSLFIPEYVNELNFDKMRTIDGTHLWRNQKLIFNHSSDKLQVGDCIKRPLADGDVILVNRPPSVHQHSLIALSARILPMDSVVSINPLCCVPLLGDFDGDCLHGYVPQSIHCRIELQELVSLDHQLLNGQDRRNLLSLTHDSLTAAHLLTDKAAFLNKYEIQQLEMLCSNPALLPVVLKGPVVEGPLWTGQQLLSMLFPISLDFQEVSKKFWLRSKPENILYKLFKGYGKKALDHLFSAQDALCEYLTMRGLTVSLSDVYLTCDTYSRMKMMDELNFGLQEAIDAYRAKELLLGKVVTAFEGLDEAQDLSLNLNLNRARVNWASVDAFKNIFSDIQNAIHNYIGRNNSMMEMINAGSKGSLLKLVQQGACLGMQLSAFEMPFKIPRALSCIQWNLQKKLDQYRVLDVNDGGSSQNDFVVIEASLLDGLNPLECFFHALSGRTNLFSANADLPGTLSRKLMFYMRDLYVAYDGSVRNVNRENIVQFCYNFPEDSEFCELSTDGKVSTSIPGGQPVGSWASCSISEAAYGALECPMNPLFTSPLMNLKAILESSTGRTTGACTVSLFLSNKLQRLRYGCEHGALEIKSHLEKVIFADIVSTVMIFYAGKDGEGTKLSPWVIHFHMDKERMGRRRLDVDLVREQLVRGYEKRARFDYSFPKLFIESKCYLSGDKREKCNAMDCISVTLESTGSPTLLDTMRDTIIPFLLASLVRGFSECEKIDILWDDTRKDSIGELMLKVTMSENCLPAKFWSFVQDACVPIMGLIDWNRSHPDNICKMSNIFGITAAWLYFIRSLKSTAFDIGRDIYQGHLNIVADCLFVTGEFHGLSKKGVKKQIDQSATSSPFTLACLSNPASCFIDAAKQDCEDDLRGTLDAVSWGKESPIGTGGPFKIIYSGKVCNPNEKESIYEMLHCQDDIYSSRARPMLADAGDNTKKWDMNCCTKYNEKSCFLPRRKFVASRNALQADIFNMHTSLRAILLKYPINRYVSEADKEILRKAIAFHPRSDAKIGIGIQDFKASTRGNIHIQIYKSKIRCLKYTCDSLLIYVGVLQVGYSSMHPGSKCFILVRKDGTTEDFSYHKCVAGAAAQVSPECAEMVDKKYQRKHQRCMSLESSE
ncbi:DNA-directed RNA polymerase D subunit 1 [Apostasia shenzhenica]|uniref:DNA-directed RNA polymerase subunit n=1 Tax=Apostasia shenzhenica TaxID=1088818 RepID=A0A2I0AEK3_9ASPA|nr:DNA-directed RNA polymerase D subunit 1 [Apostasia shenzhenica]